MKPRSAAELTEIRVSAGTAAALMGISSPTLGKLIKYVEARSFFMQVIPASVAQAVEQRIPEAAEFGVYEIVEDRVREGLEQFGDGVTAITAKKRAKRGHLRLAKDGGNDGDRDSDDDDESAQ